MELTKEALKQIQDAIAGPLKEGLDGIRDEFNEKLKPVDDIKTGVDELKSRVEKIEKLPANMKIKESERTKDVLFGRKVHKSCQKLREMAGKNPSRFDYLKGDEQIDEFAKFMLTFVEVSKRTPSAEAQQKMHEIQEHVKTTLNEGTSAQGGYLVPVEYQWDMVMLNKDRTFAVNLCTVRPMTSMTQKIPAELTRAAVAWKDEAAQLTQSDPTFSQVSLTAEKLTAFTAANNEMIADSALDIAGIITDQMSYGMLLELDNQTLNGTGSIVSGILTAKAGYSVVMSTAAFSNISYADVSLLIDQIPEGYDDNLSLVMNKRILHYLRTETDTYGRPILQLPGESTPGTIYQVPYVKTSQATKTSAASTAFVACGNFKYFYIGQRLGIMTLDVDPYGLFDYDQTRYRMVTRFALAVAQANAFARLLTSA